MRTTQNQIRGMDPANRYLSVRANRVLRSGSGLAAYMSSNPSSVPDGTNTITAASTSGGAVVTNTSPGGAVTTSAPANTPPSVLSQKLGSTKGALGFLTWAVNGLPPQIAQAVMQAAQARSISYRQSGGMLGIFGDTGDDSDYTDPDLATYAISSPTIVDPGVDTSSLSMPSFDLSTGSSTPASVASNAAPTSAWTSSMANTVATVAAATLSAADAATVNSLTQTQLQRAANGDAPLAVAAGAGIGSIAAGSGKTLLWGGAIIGAILLLMSMSKR
jgi:hypothetical protein